MLERKDLHEYQNRMVEYVLERRASGLFLNVGMGKTTIALTGISDMLDDLAVFRVLVIAPIRVCQKTWRQEASKWEHIQHLKVIDCTGTPAQRLRSLQSDADVYLINPEITGWLTHTFRGKRKWKWDMIVFDESHLFKSSDAKRFRAICRVLKYAPTRLILTGTPSANGIGDLWGQVFLLDQGKRLFRHVTQFRAMYMKPAGYKGKSWAARKGSDLLIREKIADITTSLNAAEHLTLPKRITIDRVITLPPKVKAMYDKLQEDLVAIWKGNTLMSKTAMSVGIKLRQICNGAVYNDEDEVSVIHDLKLKEVINLLEDQPNERFLLCYQFKHDVARIIKAIPYARVMDKKGHEIDRWNAKKTRLLLMYASSAGAGTNMQAGGANMIWYGLNYTLRDYIQACGRIDRQGQTETVRIIRILAEDTIEQTIAASLKNKAITQEELLKYLKYKTVNKN